MNIEKTKLDSHRLIESLFEEFSAIRYVAVYIGDLLVYQEKEKSADSSSSESDKYEELLVNPTLLKLAGQRGNIDCGGLRYIMIRYGNFYQLIKEIPKGHISICLSTESDINKLPPRIIDYLNHKFSNLMHT